MRDIKLRAWDKRTKQWHKGVPFEVHPETWIESAISLEWLEVMQYTGLKDKNGKEVYEGDVVKCESGITNLETGEPTGQTEVFYQEVIFHEGMFTKKARNGYIDKFAPFPDIWAKYYEVVGNVYEHSHLLEEGTL